jgi:hypothetical protein
MGDDLRERVRHSIERRGLKETARRLGLHPLPTLRLAGGSGVKHATEALARVNASRLEDDQTSPEVA